MPLSYDMTTFYTLGQKSLGWFFGKFKTSKSHSEINWPLESGNCQIFLIFWSKSCRFVFCYGLLKVVTFWPKMLGFFYFSVCCWGWSLFMAMSHKNIKVKIHIWFSYYEMGQIFWLFGLRKSAYLILRNDVCWGQNYYRF